MQIQPEQLRQQSFKTRMRGYDTDEVKGFLMSVADSLEELQDENRSLSASINALKSKQHDLEELFLQAKRFSDEKSQEAQATAQRTIEEAQARARKLEEEAAQNLEKAKQFLHDKTGEAASKAKEIIREAEEKARSISEDATRLMHKAEADAREIEDNARVRAREILAGAEKQKLALEGQIVEVQTRKNSLFAELKATLDACQSWVATMSDVDPHAGG